MKKCVLLSEEEKLLLRQGHKVITDFIDSCLEDIMLVAPNVAKNINPYSQYKPIRQVTIDNKINKDFYKQCSSIFKNTNLYKDLLNSPMWENLKNMPKEHIEQLIGVLDRDILKSPLDIIPDDIREFSYRMKQNSSDPQNILMRDSCIMLSLREMLVNACQLMYSALVGNFK